MTSVKTTTERIEKVTIPALVVGLVALGLLLIGIASGTADILKSYLTAYLYWWQVTIGCVALTMLNHLVGGRWGYVSRPILTAGIMTLPVLAVLFIPLAFGLEDVYIWANAETVAANELLQHKSAYLNASFFRIRGLAYFVIWILISLPFCRLHFLKREPSGLPASASSGQSGLGLVLLTMTVSFAAMDWGMSVEPLWYSTIYGGLMAVGGGLTALALTAGLTSLGAIGPLDEEDNIDVLQDLGSLLLAFIMLWAYFAFSQFLIIWSGNLPDEIRWYLTRLDGGWQWLALLIVLFHFFVPFFLLIDRNRKRQPQAMLVIACLILLIHYLEVFWTIRPGFRSDSSVHWADFLAPLAVGGVWVAAFTWQLARRLSAAEEAEPTMQVD